MATKTDELIERLGVTPIMDDVWDNLLEYIKKTGVLIGTDLMGGGNQAIISFEKRQREAYESREQLLNSCDEL